MKADTIANLWPRPHCLQGILQPAWDCPVATCGDYCISIFPPPLAPLGALKETHQIIVPATTLPSPRWTLQAAVLLTPCAYTHTHGTTSHRQRTLITCHLQPHLILTRPLFKGI